MNEITHPISTEFPEGVTTSGHQHFINYSKPKRHYTKRSPYWRITLKQRIHAAYIAFKRGR